MDYVENNSRLTPSTDYLDFKECSKVTGHELHWSHVPPQHVQSSPRNGECPSHDVQPVSQNVQSAFMGRKKLKIQHGLSGRMCRCQLWPLMPLLLLLGLSPLPSLVARAAVAEPTQCIIDNEGELFVRQTNYFYHNHVNLPIVLEDSNRLSHQVANHILKILLESVAGYPEVRIQHCYSYDNQNITALLDRISGIKVSKHCQPPESNTIDRIPDTMVNLEAWMVAGFNKAPWLDTHQLVDAGPLGPQGRMGWFLPDYFVEELWENSNIVADHWRALLNNKVTRKLSLWDSRRLNLLASRYKRKAFKCKRCKGLKRRNCATLFAMYRGVDTGVLEAQINELNLMVDIVYLEDQLFRFVRMEVVARRPVMFFNWHPNTLIARRTFARISFPETRSDNKEAALDFPVNQLTKVLWGPLKSGAPEAYHIISKMSFTDVEYNKLLARTTPMRNVNISTDSLLYEVNMELIPEKVACKWIRENLGRWSQWLPPNLKEKPKIYLGGLFPMSGNVWAERGLVEGAKLALNIVNEDPSVLPKHKLELVVNDTRCDHDVAIGQFIAMHRIQPPIAGILGPGCSESAERIASLSKHFHLAIVSYGAQTKDMSDRTKYPYFFRTIPPAHLYKQTYPLLFEKLGWQVVGTLTVSGQHLPEYHLDLTDRLRSTNEESASSDHPAFVVKRKVLNTTSAADVVKILKEFKAENVKVIIADVSSSTARLIMCEAFKQHMTGYEGYAWFLPGWYPRHWQDVEYYNSEPSLHEVSHSPHSSLLPIRESVACTNTQVERAAQGHFVLSRASLADPDTTIAGGITVEMLQKMYARQCGIEHVEESRFAGFVYDAVWVFANGLDKLLRQDAAALETIGTQANARALQQAISNLSFSGASGWIRFDRGRCDRVTDLTIQQVFQNETLLVGRFSPNIAGGSPNSHIEDSPLLQLDTSKIRWLSPVGAVLDELVSEKEECYIENIRASLDVSCTVASIVVIVLAFFVIIIIVIGVLLLIKYRCDTKMKKLKAIHERMNELGLLSEEYSHLLVVDNWEIPLENIVLNRELGEGAFGAGMGGEMLKEKEGWVAVAVKTLKVHHTMEEKLDFFSEVDMMKLFQHKNIVQLLGVCTRQQPMYAVMEFLLHGDLKTYLLSRRSLVGQGVKEAEDTKAENLTQMAVDVASGLSYLHSLKYIHRDLACRNCLVHANKTVKIADFGLTRHVSSTDYYRFSRKGMLPVRWTAPEALQDGIYSAKTDIWSYGVLVFEIVTFGSFPYQGLTNRQVMEEVLRGAPLKLPLQCNDALRSFIRWCMSPDPGYRPDLSDILSYLEYSPAFLTPCIDAPITSVVHEDTDSMGDDSRIPRSLSFVTTPLAVSTVPLLTPDRAGDTFGGGSVSCAGCPAEEVDGQVTASFDGCSGFEQHTLSYAGSEDVPCFTPNSSLTSTPQVSRQRNHYQPALISLADSPTVTSIGDSPKLVSSSRRRKHYSSSAISTSDGGGSVAGCHIGRIRDKKKTFSMPGLLYSLGRAGKSSGSINTRHDTATCSRSLASHPRSRSVSVCSETGRPSSVCGLDHCVPSTRGSGKQQQHCSGNEDVDSLDNFNHRNNASAKNMSNFLVNHKLNGHVDVCATYPSSNKRIKQIFQNVTSL